MPTKSGVLKAFTVDTRRLAVLFRKNQRAGDAYKKSVQSYIEDALFDLATGGRLNNDMITMQRLDMIAQQLPDLMRGRYADSLSNEILSTVTDRIRTADTTMRRIGLQNAVLGENAQRLPSVISRSSIMAESVVKGSSRASQKVADKIIQYKLQLGSGVAYSEIVNTLVSHAGIASKYAGTIANTELAALDTDIRIEQTKAAGLTLLRYTGPINNNTRDFCVRWLGEAHPIEFWDNLDNETGPQPVSRYRGGFNCLHRLIPWSEEWDD